MEKKQSKRLTVGERALIVERLRAGELGANLAKEYGVSKAAISKLKVNAENILSCKASLEEQHGSLKKKKISGVENSALERAIYHWFIEKRTQNEPVSGVAICEKALQFNAKLNNSQTFKASSGWLDKFKKRHGIRELARRRGSAGELGANLAKEYGETKATTSKLKAEMNAENVSICRADPQRQHGSPKKRKTSGVKNTALERAIYDWFVQKRTLNEPVSGVALCEKALEFNTRLNDSQTFKATTGWLDNFKERHGIGELATQEETLSADLPASAEFSSIFRNYIEDFGYTPNQIYNADETGLQWKSLPNRLTFEDDSETVAPGCEVPKDRVTLMVCANASGTHKVPLLVISKSAKPRCLKDIRALRVVHRARRSAWMDRALFTEWYRDIFLPEIEAHHRAPGDKCILLLDNAPSHPPVEELNAMSNKCTVIYLPPNVTSISQPMNQGVIDRMKKIYRKNMLRELLLNEEYLQDVATFYKHWSLLHCCNFIAAAWDGVTQENIKNSWKKIIPQAQSFDNDRISSYMHLELLHRVPEFGDTTIDQTKQWLDEDSSDPGWKVLSDEEILFPAGRQNLVEVDTENDEDVENEEREQEQEPAPSPNEALHALDTFLRWYQTRWECTQSQLLQLQQCRDIAAQESMPYM